MIRTITQMTNGAITAGVDLHGLAGAQKAANIVHGNVTNVDIENHLARDGAHSLDIVGTLLLIKSMERTAQDALKIED